MSASSPAIEVSNLGKRYRLGVRETTRDTLVAALGSWVHSPFASYRRLRDLTRFADGVDTPDTIWALRDVSFELTEGETLGIIGRNGAGKSTLLKILSRITPPSTGRAVLRGRVASLLEVGTGFHPELSGRENVYLNGTLLGMSRQEIDRKLDEIVEFAGVAKFLDTPIKRYSSGMQVRLAFSVAAHLDVEILVIDEVLAVGDFEFQKRCLGRMEKLAGAGRTVLFVSHNMPAVQGLCSRCLLLQGGSLVFDGATESAIRTHLHEQADDAPEAWYHRKPPTFVRLTKARLLVAGAESRAALSGQQVEFELEFTGRCQALPPGGFGVSLTLSRDGVVLSNLWTHYAADGVVSVSRQFVLTCRIEKWPFAAGRFSVALFSHWSDLTAEEWAENVLEFDSIDGDFFGSGRLPAAAKGVVFVDHVWRQRTLPADRPGV